MSFINRALGKILGDRKSKNALMAPQTTRMNVPFIQQNTAPRQKVYSQVYMDKSGNTSGLQMNLNQRVTPRKTEYGFVMDKNYTSRDNNRTVYNNPVIISKNATALRNYAKGMGYKI